MHRFDIHVHWSRDFAPETNACRDTAAELLSRGSRRGGSRCLEPVPGVSAAQTAARRRWPRASGFFVGGRSQNLLHQKVDRVSRLKSRGSLGFFRGGDFGNPTRTGGLAALAVGLQVILCICELGRGRYKQCVNTLMNELFHDESFIKIKF